MYYFGELEKALFIKRYKRFLVDVEMSDGSIITVHCANTGSMKGCYEQGDVVYIRKKKKPIKLDYGLEMIDRGGDNNLIVVNTMIANELIYNALREGNDILKQNWDFSEVQREKKYGQNSRIDILGYEKESEKENKCYIELKSVSMINNERQFSFPDAKTSRGVKHLEELTRIKEVEQSRAMDRDINIKSRAMKSRIVKTRAVMGFVCMRGDGEGFEIARDIDPEYGRAFDKALHSGVEAYVIYTKITQEKIDIVKMETL